LRERLAASGEAARTKPEYKDAYGRETPGKTTNIRSRVRKSVSGCQQGRRIQGKKGSWEGKEEEQDGQKSPDWSLFRSERFLGDPNDAAAEISVNVDVTLFRDRITSVERRKSVQWCT